MSTQGGDRPVILASKATLTPLWSTLDSTRWRWAALNLWLIFHCKLYECDEIASVHPGSVESRDIYKDPQWCI